MAQVVIPDVTAAPLAAGRALPAPPNPLEMAGQAVNIEGGLLQNQGLQNKLTEFNSQQAASRDFQSSINPLTGQLDQPLLNRTLAKDPTAALAAPTLSQQGLVNFQTQLQSQGITQTNAIQSMNYVANQTGSLLLKPGGATRADVVDSLADAVAQHIMPAKQAASIVPTIPESAPQLQQWLRGHYTAAQRGIAAITPHVTVLNNGEYQLGYNINPAAGPVGVVPGSGAVQNTLPPGAQATVVQDVNGNPVIQQRDALGNIVGASPYPSGNTGGQPASAGNGAQQPPVQMTRAPGETPGSYQDLQGWRASINKEALNVPQVLDTSNQIVSALNDIGTNGRLGSDVAGLSSRIGYALGDDTATAYQKIGHFAALQTANLAHVMGVDGSVSGLGTAAQMAGKTDWTPAAIRSVNQTNEAYAAGIGVMSAGAEAAVRRSGGDIGVLRQFRDAWSNNFSVDAMRLFNGVQQDGGKLGANYAAAKKEMGPSAFKIAAKKAAQLAQLSSGVIPK